MESPQTEEIEDDDSDEGETRASDAESGGEPTTVDVGESDDEEREGGGNEVDEEDEDWDEAVCVEPETALVVGAAAELPNALMRLLEAGRGAAPVLGIELGWEEETAAEAGGRPAHPDILQLSVGGACVNFRLRLLGFLPDSLRALLDDPGMTLVGWRVSAAVLRQFEAAYDVPVTEVLDVADLASYHGCRGRSLRGLARELLGARPNANVAAVASSWLALAAHRHLAWKRALDAVEEECRVGHGRRGAGGLRPPPQPRIVEGPSHFDADAEAGGERDDGDGDGDVIDVDEDE